MQPLSEFRDQLFKNAGADSSRITDFSCGHVIPPENILPIIVCSGSSGKQLDYSYQTRNSLFMVKLMVRHYLRLKIQNKLHPFFLDE